MSPTDPVVCAVTLDTSLRTASSAFNGIVLCAVVRILNRLNTLGVFFGHREIPYGAGSLLFWRRVLFMHLERSANDLDDLT